MRNKLETHSFDIVCVCVCGLSPLLNTVHAHKQKVETKEKLEAPTIGHLSRRRAGLQPGGVLCALWGVSVVGRDLLPHFSVGVQTSSLCGHLCDREHAVCH